MLSLNGAKHVVLGGRRARSHKSAEVCTGARQSKKSSTVSLNGKSACLDCGSANAHAQGLERYADHPAVDPAEGVEPRPSVMAHIKH